jgi:uncharacterized protein
MATAKADWFRADDARIDELDRLLEQRAVPFGGYGLEQLDGYLTALAVSPGTVAPEEWLPQVWGKAPPRWEGPADEAARPPAARRGGAAPRAPPPRPC